MNTDTYHHGNLAEALVEAGIEILESEGLDALSLRAAARAVGVSHGAPARHFEDATSFLAAVAATGYRRLAGELADAAGHGKPDEAFFEMGRGYVRFALAHPHWYRAIFHHTLADVSRYPDLGEASDLAFGHLRGSIGRAAAEGFVRDDDVATLALAAWATVHGVSTLLIDRQLVKKGYLQSDDELVDNVLVAMFLGFRRG